MHTYVSPDNLDVWVSPAHAPDSSFHCSLDDGAPARFDDDDLIVATRQAADAVPLAVGENSDPEAEVELRVTSNRNEAWAAIQAFVETALRDLSGIFSDLRSRALVDLLIEAHDRGVWVRIVSTAPTRPMEEQHIALLHQAGIKVGIVDELPWGDYGVADSERAIISPEAWTPEDAPEDPVYLAIIEDPVVGDRLLQQFDEVLAYSDTAALFAWETLTAGNDCFNFADDDGDGPIDFADPSCFLDTGTRSFTLVQTTLGPKFCEEVIVESEDLDEDGWLETILFTCINPGDAPVCLEPDYPTPLPYIVICPDHVEVQ